MWEGWCTNLRLQIAMETKYFMLTPSMCDTEYGISLCHCSGTRFCIWLRYFDTVFVPMLVISQRNSFPCTHYETLFPALSDIPVVHAEISCKYSHKWKLHFYTIILKWTNTEQLTHFCYYNGFLHRGNVNSVFLIVVDKNIPAWVNFRQ